MAVISHIMTYCHFNGAWGCGSVADPQLSTCGSGSIPAFSIPVKKWFILFLFLPPLPQNTVGLADPSGSLHLQIKGRNQSQGSLPTGRGSILPNTAFQAGQSHLCSFSQGSLGPQGTLDNRLDLHGECFPAGVFGFGDSALCVRCVQSRCRRQC